MSKSKKSKRCAIEEYPEYTLNDLNDAVIMAHNSIGTPEILRCLAECWREDSELFERIDMDANQKAILTDSYLKIANKLKSLAVDADLAILADIIEARQSIIPDILLK